MILASFIIFSVGLSLVIGLFASRKSHKTEQDYFLAGQTISPYILALSSAASKFSGFMFAGFMGLAYSQGIKAVWFGLGLITGHFLSYAFTVTRLQKMNEGGWALSIAELITFWNGENRVLLRRFIGLLTLFFLAIYAAAQLKAGGKALEVALEQPAYVGILLSTVVILFYCWSGGIRASIWTDTAQVLIMCVSLLLILIMAINNEGGFGHFYSSFLATAPPGSDQVALIPKNLSTGGIEGLGLYLLGCISLGVATIGQPHILIRPMALQSPRDTKKFIVTNYLFEIFFIALVILVGLSTRIILQGMGSSFDPELSLFITATKLLPPVAIGFILAGAFSSTLSTADSQIISCSASLLRDLPEPPKDSLLLAKIGTVIITVIATVTALFAQKNIFTLVTFAFAGLGASIGSLLVLRLAQSKISELGALLVALAGGTTVILWEIFQLKPYINSAFPGFTMAFITYLVFTLLSRFWSNKEFTPTQ